MDAKNMNYEYSFIGKDFILSPKEHEYILECLEKGIKQVILREGQLGMNLTTPFSFKETNELTIPEREAKSVKLLAQSNAPSSLGEDREFGMKFMAENHERYYAKMGWDHKENCICKTNKRYIAMRESAAFGKA